MAVGIYTMVVSYAMRTQCVNIHTRHIPYGYQLTSGALVQSFNNAAEKWCDKNMYY